tara:strand:+ start:2490 stop:2963 length:474 start_codon:yes stop_codon:yes gene_type:complete
MALTRLNNQALPAGSVLQVVQFFDQGSDGATKSSLASITDSTFVDIMSKTITTKQTNSKILVNMKTNGYNGGSIMRGLIKVFRDSTKIDSDQYGFYGPAALMNDRVFDILDSPNVSSGTTLTYKMQCNNYGSGTLDVGYGDGSGGASSSITLTEISV